MEQLRLHINSRRPILFASLSIALLAVIFFTPLGTLHSAEKPGIVAPVLWPSEIENWRIAEGPTLYGPDSAYEYMDGAAEFFLAYNMKRLVVLRYEKPGRPAIFLEIYLTSSPEDAYGIFSFQSDDPGAGIGQGSEFGGGLLRFWKGPYFVTVYGEEPASDVEEATLGIGRNVASSIPETGSPPKLLSQLPREAASFKRTQSWFLRSHILLNQRFFVARQNVLNLSGDVEAVLARYESGKKKIHLLLIGYPTQERAQTALANLEKAYTSKPGETFSLKSEEGTWTRGERQGRFLVIVFNVPDEKQAAQLTAAVSTGLEVKRK